MDNGRISLWLSCISQTIHGKQTFVFEINISNVYQYRNHLIHTEGHSEIQPIENKSASKVIKFTKLFHVLILMFTKLSPNTMNNPGHNVSHRFVMKKNRFHLTFNFCWSICCHNDTYHKERHWVTLSTYLISHLTKIFWKLFQRVKIFLSPGEKI